MAAALLTALPAGSIVAVIGAGAMGSGIAQVAAAAGYKVKLFDTRFTAADSAIALIGDMYDRLTEKGRMSRADNEAARARLARIDSLRDAHDASLVIEAIVENLDVKRMLFADLEGVVGHDCILATNTSSISVTAIAAKLLRPGRLVGMHFFNPVPLMGLVEVISGLATDPGVAGTVFATAAAWGKEPVHARSTPGFIVNRVARPFYAEALRLLGEGAADHATIDALMVEAGGFRMGPFELMDLIGHDVNLAVTRSVFDAHYGDPRFTPSVIQQELVEAGFLGRKTGRGFYRYGSEAEMPQPHSEPPYSRADQAVALHLTDGRTATERAAADGHADTVLVDLCVPGAKRVAVARSDQCSEAAYRNAVGQLQADGYAVSRIDDVPGMVVMRTVAMLANEAADTVNQRVCSAAAVDLAMQKGVNYPRGPLAWAEQVGLAHIVTVLSNLAAAYGEDRYRVSPLLRRKVAAGGRFHE